MAGRVFHIVVVVAAIAIFWLLNDSRQAAKDAKPRLYTLGTSIQLLEHHRDLDEILNEWIDFCWIKGAGLPWPFAPIQIGTDGLRYIPPVLLERMTSRKVKGTVAVIEYQVDNPGIWTFLHTHQGRIMFFYPSDTTLSMKWEVELRPFASMADPIQTLTVALISFYSQNFKLHLQKEPLFSILESSTWRHGNRGSWRDGYLSG